MRTLTARLKRDGFALAGGALSASELNALDQGLPIVVHGAGVRNLISNAAVAAILRRPAIRDLVHRVLGSGAVAYRATLFDKHAGANWAVPWHQDLSIPVNERVASNHWSCWCEKAGVLHAQPPADVLDQILTVRVHIDAAPVENGPLRVIPGSHRLGRISAEALPQITRSVPASTCVANPGDLLWMRPLLIHASSRATSPSRRRILHVEFASTAVAHGSPSIAAA